MGFMKPLRQSIYTGFMPSLLAVINSFTDSKRLILATFLDISSLFGFSIKQYKKRVSETRIIEDEGYNKSSKKALKNGLIHSSKFCISSNNRERNQKAKVL